MRSVTIAGRSFWIPSWTRCRSVAFVCALLTILGGVIWLAEHPLDPDFHGKPESFWINGLKNPNWMSRVSDYQGHVRVVYQPWQDFGPAGVPLLVKALKRNRPWDKFYGKVWPKLPSFVGSRLPKPMDDSEVRARAASVLHGMGKDAQMAVPALEQALQDESDRVRQTALAALKVQLPGMGLEKSRLLPMFLTRTPK